MIKTSKSDTKDRENERLDAVARSLDVLTRAAPR